MDALTRAHTSDLDGVVRAEIRALDEAFDGGFSDDDWELIAHASVVQRRLVAGGVALRTGYVEALTSASPALDLTGPIACDWRTGDVW